MSVKEKWERIDIALEGYTEELTAHGGDPKGVEIMGRTVATAARDLALAACVALIASFPEDTTFSDEQVGRFEAVRDSIEALGREP